MEKQKSFTLGLSLVDVIYGVIFAYGFNFLANANNFYDYSRFFFAYLILIIDWLYSHQTYQKNLYEKNFIILDLLILFAFSRILTCSVANNPTFYFWIAFIFIFYLFWDKISQKLWKKSFRQFIITALGDGLGALGFIIIWFLINQQIIVLNSLATTIAGLIVYLIAISFWYIRPKQKIIRFK
jgi:hypothetical protein